MSIDPEESKEQEFLNVCNNLELKLLAISKAEKALNALKDQKEQLSLLRERLRKELMGDVPNQAAGTPQYPAGYRGRR